MLIVVLMAVVLFAVLSTAEARSRSADRTTQSQFNLRLLGAGSAGFASDNAGEIFTFDPNINVGRIEAIDIISRLTGRPIGGAEPNRLLSLQSIMPHRRYQHLVLFDYFGSSATNEVAASPFDRNLLNWQAEPVLAQSTTVPYVSQIPPAGTDRSVQWNNDDVRQLWPYGSTYQTVPAAWNPNNNNGEQKSWVPVNDTPNLFSPSGSTSLSGQQRYYPGVVFPSGKVHLFEEFDRYRWRDHLWFAYPEAKCNLLFFDGSVRRLLSSDSNPGWNPSSPSTVWNQRYYPLDKFPRYAIGYKTFDEFFMKYRWTREGLGGIDYGGDEPNRPTSANPKHRPDPTGSTSSPRDIKTAGASPID
ncbi:MAG: prepilin-type processing-associated H-X9-DG protein [Phycisphaerales bacterium]